MYDFWHFWDQTNCPHYRGVRKGRLYCTIDILGLSFIWSTLDQSIKIKESFDFTEVTQELNITHTLNSLL